MKLLKKTLFVLFVTAMVVLTLEPIGFALLVLTDTIE